MISTEVEVPPITHQDNPANPLPACVTEYIDQVIRRMRYSRSARREVRQELLDHFTDALADRPNPQQRQKLAETLITEFGDTKLLAALLRRAKKRNRPAWEKAIIRTAQGFLLLLVLFGLYTAWFMNGQPTISTNYLAVLSDRLHPKAPESENAWPLYHQAILQYVPTPPVPIPDPTGPPWGPYSWPETDIDPASLPEVLRVALGKWIDQNEPAWQAYVAASRKPSCWYASSAMEDLHMELVRADVARRGETIRPSTAATQPDDWIWKDSAMALLLPHLGPIRILAKDGIFKAHLAMAQGNPREALEDALTDARVARHWQNPNGCVIEQLVGAAISHLASEEIRRLAGDKTFTAADLQRVQEELEALYPHAYPTFGVESDRIGLTDTIQRVFTEGGPGGGHIIPRQAWIITRDGGLWGDNQNGRSVGITSLSTATWLLHAGRDDTLAMVNAYYDRVAAWSKLTPYQQKDEPDPDQMLRKMDTLERLRYQFLYHLLPSFTKAPELIWRARCEYEATLTVLALQRFHLDKGQYPPSLEALVQAGYLRQVPLDPYSAGLLVYRLTDDGFTLYSVGKDFADDGGIEDPDNPWEGKLKDGRGSDRVFWPVAPLKPYPVDPT